ELSNCCQSARKNGTLRTMVESIAVLDPVLADFLYILDHTSDYRPTPRLRRPGPASNHPIRLTNWQSYGRPEIRDLEREIDRIRARMPVAVVLPCSRRRPYDASRTHKRIWIELDKQGINHNKVHQVVVTSLGILPEELWNHPVVLMYDAGVPDIYRILRLCRRFFSQRCYRKVVNCLQFEPYSDVLAILRREGIIRNLARGPVTRKS